MGADLLFSQEGDFNRFIKNRPSEEGSRVHMNRPGFLSGEKV